ncbi:hypothetical protein [Burkholderia lata]|nr:hypothetical protein [Burkholderia lata]
MNAFTDMVLSKAALDDIRLQASPPSQQASKRAGSGNDAEGVIENLKLR